MSKKTVLLIAGGGTLGRYVSAELLKHGNGVDVICLENYSSDNENLHYYKANADLEYLKDFLKDKHYDAIVNFIHYTSLEAYKPIHKLLSDKTEQAVFLSSYRVYADLQHPITEKAPHLLDTVNDEIFLKNEDYAVPKSLCEKYIRDESGTDNWTVVRPVISFSDRRYDIVTAHSPEEMRDAVINKKPIYLPIKAKNLTAGVDWAGNSGKLIAGLLFKKSALCEAFTVSSAPNLKWSDIADMYAELGGIKFEWLDDSEYLKRTQADELSYLLKYDRFFDRTIDNSKILNVTGLNSDDFTSVYDGIKIELSKIL